MDRFVFYTEQDVNSRCEQAHKHLVNIEEHLACKEADISLRRWWRPKTELKDGLRFIS